MSLLAWKMLIPLMIVKLDQGLCQMSVWPLVLEGKVSDVKIIHTACASKTYDKSKIIF